MKRWLWILATPAIVLCVVSGGNGGNRYDSFADFVNAKGWVMSGFLIAAALAVVMILITEVRGKRKQQNGSPPS